MKRFNFLFTFFLINVFLITNGQEKKDTTSILYAFSKGKIEGHFRFIYMSTNNYEPLTDYYAFAFGGGLKYQTVDTLPVRGSSNSIRLDDLLFC